MRAEVLDLFSAAAGGWSLGMHRAGFTTVAACEVEAWRRALYSENNPEVRMYDDVRTLTATRLRDDLGRLPSIVVGSPPCQDISSANTKGRGVEGERSGLYFEAVRLIGEIRPRWFALENSSNLRTRGADAVLAALEALGYACWAVVVRAGDIGANHERPRAWLIGCDVEQVTDADREFPDGWAVLPNPMASDGMKDGAGGGSGSTHAFRQILAIPRKTDADRGFRGDVLAQLQGQNNRHAGMMPAPLKSDHKGSLGVMSRGKVKSPNVPTALRDGKWDYARQIAAMLTEAGLIGPSLTLPTTYGWMMGYPPGWLARAFKSAMEKGNLLQASPSRRSAMPSSPKSPKP